MSSLKNASERASDQESILIDRLASIYERCPLTQQEKILNSTIFMRRQELSYLIANYEIFKLIENIKGSIFYFGVYHGAGLMSFANLSAAFEPFNHTREIIGFDTFSGYPHIGEEDKTHGKEYTTLVEGGFCSNSLDFLQEVVEVYNANRPLGNIKKLSFIKGDICETLPHYLASNQHTIVSLAVITVNLYEPIKIILSQLWPRMPRGGVVIIRSINEEYYPGATTVLMEVLGSNQCIQTFPFAPNLAYIVK